MGCLKQHFGDKLTHIDLSGTKLTPETKGQMKELKEQIEKLTTIKSAVANTKSPS